MFGYACFPNLRPYNSHKFSVRSKPCVFLGYSSHHKGYKCFHPETGRIFVSRDVIFHEEVFPFSHAKTNSESSPTETSSSNPVSVSLQISPTRELVPNSPSSSPPNPLFPTSPAPLSSSPPPSSSPAEPAVQSALTLSRIHPIRTRSQNNVRIIRQLTDGTVRYPLPRALLAESALIEPTCFSTAVKVSEWRTAMQVEFNALLKNQT